tara:strand:+ start:4603 stop:4800 length:198 start_codon:yes stop_codon:yes gene_type:complete
MLYYIGVIFSSVLLTIIVSVTAITGWLFITGGGDWLTQILGGSMIALTFLLVTLAFMIVRLYAEN